MAGRAAEDEGRPAQGDGGGAPPASVAADAPAPLRPKIEVFGKYRILGEMGHGGMADVFLAVDIGPAGIGKLQVIKRLRAGLAEDTELRAMLLDEARLAARLNHRNVVQTMEVGQVEDQYFIAMELLDGQPLNRILRRCKTKGAAFPLPFMLQILSEVLAGLHYAHEAKDYDGQALTVVHRDVSPHNIFITYDGQVKVMDFGIAKAARRVVETETGVVRGKVAYMAPEQALPKTKGLDRRADIFSVGVMLWEVLVGERMWGQKADPEILLRLSTRGAPPLPDRPDIPADLAHICKRAIMRDREQRYATAAEMRADIEAHLQKLEPAPSAEMLGQQVAEMFADDRARIQKIIERQLAALRTHEIADEPTWTRSKHRVGLDGVKSGTSDRPPEGEGTGHGARSLRPSERTPLSVAGRGAASGGSRAWLVGVGALAVAGALFAMRHRLLGEPPAVAAGSPSGAVTTAASVTAAPTPTATATAAQAPSDEGYVRVHITVTPPGARILLDGIAMGSNPFDGKLVKDSAMHRLQVDAPGFQAQGRMVSLASDLDLTITLLPREKAATSATSSQPAPPPLKPR